jgi:AcrR family transcriptional regulator
VTAVLDPHPTRGRPRDPHCAQAILRATAELVSELGYERTTVDAIAARAGVSKPTIYRRWPGGKEELVAASVTDLRDEVSPPIDTGSLRGDLVAVLRQMIGGMQMHAHLAAGLTQRLRESPELREMFRERVLVEDRARFAAIIDRAVARGELAPMRRVSTLLADLAPALVHFRALVSGDALDGRFVRQFVDTLLLPALREAAR